MFRSSLNIFVVLFISVVLLTQFQNCGDGGFNSLEGSEPISFSEIIQSHSDEDHMLEDVNVSKVETTYDPILLDRYYIKELLEDIFGPSTVSADSAKPYYNTAEFGAPCGLYVDHNVQNNNNWVRADAMENCTRVSPNYLNAQINPKPSVSRQAIMTRTCSDLTANNVTMDYALKKISEDGVPSVNEYNLRKVFHLFYRGKPSPPKSLVDSLSVMFPDSEATRDDWRAVFFTVCASSFWQVL